MSNKFDSLIEFYANKHGIDIELAKAIAFVESSFNHEIISSAGAGGLFQLMPRTWEEWRDGTPGIQPDESGLSVFDAGANTDAGLAYLSNLIKRFHGDTAKALAAYNWGPTIFEKKAAGHENWLELVPKETREYVEKILKQLGLS